MNIGSGVGSANLTLGVADFISSDSRTLTLTINSQSFNVVQRAGNCVYTLSETGFEVRNEGGRLSVRVTTTPLCGWAVSSTASWISLLTTSGKGTDQAHFDVAPNAGGPRQGTVSVAGQTVIVTQAGS